jgi:hypothetical protein
MRARTVLLVSATTAVAGVMLAAAYVGKRDSTSEGSTRPKPLHEDKRTVSARERAEAIARAHVWRAPRIPIAQAALRGAAAPAQIDCRFKMTDLGGTTPKFHCLLDSGREIRTKYGGVPEIPAEAAATRLLNALGFGSDTVTLVERLRCHGCPKAPFYTTKVAHATRTEALLERVVDADSVEDFEWAAIEHKFEARPIEADGQKGWGFFELDAIDSSRGGAPRAHVDALRLMALFLAHWDNKAENQRLVCLSKSWPEGRPCRQPFLLLQDVGATFGPRKVDLDAWEKAPIWADRAACAISMETLPHHGGTFGAARVSESGRQFVIRLLNQLTDAQIEDLFSGARFDQPVSGWARAFRFRQKQISDGPACPDA